MNDIFDKCVKLLIWLASHTGTTYKEINVIVFCIIEPIIFIYLLYKLKKTNK
jgi:hypothetical protein